MAKQIKLACQPQVVTIELDRILPLRTIAAGTKTTTKYQRIASSVREVGIIEPLVVFPHSEMPDHFLLLDGVHRLEVLKDLGEKSAQCLVSFDDEAFTYNHKVNQVSAIQEHFMIMTAIKNGVTEEDIAAALTIDLSKVRQKRDLLDGICPEAVELLKARKTGSQALREFRRVKPMRQIEMAELMCASGNFSAPYARCLLAATPQELLVETEQTKKADGLTPADMARMEREMETVSQDFRRIEETHGKNVLNLVIVVGYLKKLLDNARVVRYLAGNYPEILTEFQKIAESRSLSEAPIDE